MSIKTITVTDSDATVNLTNRDSLKVTFAPVIYPLTATNITGCTVTPTTIANTDNEFTATFANDFTGAYSFTLANAGPEVPHGNLDDIPNTNSPNAIGPQWAVVRETVNGVSYEKITSSTAMPWDSNGGLPLVTNNGGSYANTGISNTSQVVKNTSGHLQFNSSVYIPTFVNQAKRVINIVAYSATFTLAQGEYVRTTRTGGNDNNSRAWMYNQTTDTYTEMTQSDSVSHANAIKAPANGTYRVVVASGVYAFTSQTGTRTGTSTWGNFDAHDANGNKKTTINISGSVSLSPAQLIENTQIQEVDDALIHLFELKLPEPSSTTLFFHDGLNFDSSAAGKDIYFPTKDGTTLNEYVAFPITIDGLEIKPGGGSNKPTLSMANIPVLSRTIVNNNDGIGDETNLEQIFADEGMSSAQDFLNGTLTYRSTLLKYTSEVGDSPALPIEYPSSVFILDRVSNEQSEVIQFELTTPADLDNVELPNRRAVGKYCAWEYQGALFKRSGCTVPANAFGIFYDEDDKLITADINAAQSSGLLSTWSSSATYVKDQKVRKVFANAGGWRIYQALRSVPADKNPETNSYYWKRLDVCGKRISSCKLRFHSIVADIAANESSLRDTIITDPVYFNRGRSLPFGGFPGSKKFK